MITDPCIATIRGTPDFPDINVRLGPGTNSDVLTVLPVGTTGLKVFEVLPDAQLHRRDGKIHQWFRLELPGGGYGWVRNDLVDIAGDCAHVGYGVVASPTPAQSPTRTEPKPTANPDRVRKAAFNISASFEGGYDSYQTDDNGLVSYGRFQFTLASGSLFEVVKAYLNTTLASEIAVELHRDYATRLQTRDWTLQADPRLRELLQTAARDETMQRAQDDVATTHYWKRIYDLSIAPRDIKTPLGQAFLFDTGLNHGPFHNLIGLAEKTLGVPPKSRLSENGTTEQALIAEVARLRQERLSTLARTYKLPGLKRRGDFWAGLVRSGDWNLHGDLNGELETLGGKRVQVRHP